MAAGRTRFRLKIAYIPALLAMKGYALEAPLEGKDAYDIYYCVRNYTGGAEALADDCARVIATSKGRSAYALIDKKFFERGGFGPSSVRRFVVETALQGEMSSAQWLEDAFGQVDAWLRAMNVRR